MSDENTPAVQDHILSNEMYDRLKFLAQILLPALGTLYFALASIWGLPKAEEVIGTITAVDVFLGILLGISSKSYNESDAKYDGDMLVQKVSEDQKIYSLSLNGDPHHFDKKKQLVFKVKPTDDLVQPAEEPEEPDVT